MKGRPRSATVEKRIEELMIVQREISREKLEMKIGSTVEVIIENIADDHDFNFEARTRIDAPEIDGKVLISQGSFEPGLLLLSRYSMQAITIFTREKKRHDGFAVAPIIKLRIGKLCFKADIIFRSRRKAPEGALMNADLRI